MHSELKQLMTERMQMLEDALRRGIAGVATEDDWVLIYAECGMPMSPILTEKSRSE